MVIYECNKCNYKTNIKTHYNRHLQTRKHKSNEIERTKKDPPRPSETLRDPPRTSQTLPDPPGVKNNEIECEFCNIAVNSKNLNRHYRNSCLKIPKNFTSLSKFVISKSTTRLPSVLIEKEIFVMY